MGQLSLFDYGALDPETRIVVQQRTGEIKSLMRRSAQDIIDIGLKLIEVKERLPHGNFGPWLKDEFGWSADTAQRFMLVAERFGESEKPQIAAFAPSALYALAAPSTPGPARAEALERAAAGEEITHAAAKEIVGRHRGIDLAQTQDDQTANPGLWPGKSVDESETPPPQTKKADDPPGTPGRSPTAAPTQPSEKPVQADYSQLLRCLNNALRMLRQSLDQVDIAGGAVAVAVLLTNSGKLQQAIEVHQISARLAEVARRLRDSAGVQA